MRLLRPSNLPTLWTNALAGALLGGAAASLAWWSVAAVALSAFYLAGMAYNDLCDRDWDRRHRHMRVHTALHLLSVVIPLPVTGGSIGIGFSMASNVVTRVVDQLQHRWRRCRSRSDGCCDRAWCDFGGH